MRLNLVSKLKGLLRRHVADDAPAGIEQSIEQLIPPLPTPTVTLTLGVLAIGTQWLYHQLSEQVNPNFKNRRRYQLQVALLTEFGELLDTWDIWVWYRFSKPDVHKWAAGIVELADLVAFRASLGEIAHRKLTGITYTIPDNILSQAIKNLKIEQTQTRLQKLVEQIDYTKLALCNIENTEVHRQVKQIIESLVILVYALQAYTQGRELQISLADLDLDHIARTEIAWYACDLYNDQTSFPLNVVLTDFAKNAEENISQAFATAVFDIARDFIALNGTLSIKSALFCLSNVHFMYLYALGRCSVDDVSEQLHKLVRFAQYVSNVLMDVDPSTSPMDYLKLFGPFLTPILDVYVLKTLFNVNRQLSAYHRTKDARRIHLKDTGRTVEDNELIEQMLLAESDGFVSPALLLKAYECM